MKRTMICTKCGAERKKRAAAKRERDLLRYWLLRSHLAAVREGWEDGPSEAETRDAVVTVLANHGADPNAPEETQAVLAAGAEYHTGPGAARTRDDAATAESLSEFERGARVESEAREQRLRRAAREWHERHCDNCGGGDSLSRAHAEFFHALAEPTDDSALRAYVAAAVRAAVDRVVAAARACVAEWPHSTTEADEVIAAVKKAARAEVAVRDSKSHGHQPKKCGRAR